MKDNILEIRSRMTSELNRLVDKTEQIYLDLGKDYPQLLRELDKSISDSSDSAAGLRKDGSLESIKIIIEEGNHLTDDFNNSLSAMYSRDGELFNIIQKGVDEMGNLSQIIDNIKEISIEMELISLNAMTVALKSGTAGKAFSFITDELKKLSARTINLTDQLTANGSYQMEQFSEFGNLIEETRVHQDKLTANITKHMKNSFSMSSQALKESAEMMRTLSNSSKDVQPILMRIMQEVQLQDIIRQSIDHIYLSIDGFREIEDNWADKEKQDELAYRKIIPELCSSVLRDVEKELDQSSHVFETRSAEVSSILDSLEDKRKKFINDALTETEDGKQGILSMRHFSQEITGSLMRQVNESMKKRVSLSMKGLALLKEIVVLQRQFQSFEPIITRFHNIIVASRIEVAKQAALGDMRDTVTNMTDLIDSINKDIDGALDTIKNFLKTTDKTINDYSRVIHSEMPGLKALMDRTMENQTRLDKITNSIVDGLENFRIFTPRFFTLFKQTEQNREKMKELNNSLKSLESHLKLISENSEKERDILEIPEQKENWTIQDERLKQIIDKFTIFTHKKTASDLAGTVFEAEAVVDSGEVTLF